MGRARLGPGSSLKELQAVLSKPEVASAIRAPEPVERIVEVIKEVPVEIIRYVDREVIKEVIEEVPVQVIKEVRIEVPVFIDVPVEVIREVEKQVEVIKEVEVRVPYIQYMVPRWCRWTILLAVIELVVIGLLLEAAK